MTFVGTISMTNGDQRFQGMMYLFASIRPSERTVLQEIARDQEELFLQALELYLHGWTEGDWVEEYAIARLAKWIARDCTPSVTEKLHDLAQDKLGANSHGSLPTNYVKTYKAVLSGIEKARARELGHV